MRQVKEEFICKHCGKSYDNEVACDKCTLSHDIIYVGLERAEWKELIRDVTMASASGFNFNQKVVEKLLKYKVGISR